MDSVTLHAFEDELEKIALDPVSGRQLLRAAKKIQVKRRGSSPASYTTSSQELQILRAKHKALGTPEQMYGKDLAQFEAEGLPEVANVYRELLKTEPAQRAADLAKARKLPKKPLLRFPAGDDVSRMRKDEDLPVRQAAQAVKTPEQRMLSEAVLKGHELAETQTKIPKTHIGNPRSLGGGLYFTHISPEVLLREHNMVTTLPKSADPVRKLWQAKRARSRESEFLKGVLPQLQYGESPRLSRHARKRVMEIMSKESPRLARNYAL